VNPPFGYVATANADMTGASADGDLLSPGDTKALQLFGAADGARARRIMDVLEASDAHTSESMVELQGDHFSLYGTAFKQAFIDAGAAAPLPPEQQEIVDALTAWTGTCPTGTTGDPKSPTLDADPVAASESIGCAAFHAVFVAAVHTALADERDAADLDTLGGYDRRLVARALLDPGSITSGELFWDDVSTVGMTETRTDTLRAALALAANVLALSGDTPDAWRWGLLHTVTLRSIFDNFGIQDFNEGAYAAPGGLETVNVANPRVALPEDGDPFDFGFRSAASIRVVVEFTEDGPQIRYQLPGGNDLARESPFYNNLLPGWLANEPILFPFGPGAVTDPAAVVNIVPKP
jgi:penicillin amidase